MSGSTARDALFDSVARNPIVVAQSVSDRMLLHASRSDVVLVAKRVSAVCLLRCPLSRNLVFPVTTLYTIPAGTNPILPPLSTRDAMQSQGAMRTSQPAAWRPQQRSDDTPKPKLVSLPGHDRRPLSPQVLPPLPSQGRAGSGGRRSQPRPDESVISSSSSSFAVFPTTKAREAFSTADLVPPIATARKQLGASGGFSCRCCY